jgi:hypothetical protein
MDKVQEVRLTEARIRLFFGENGEKGYVEVPEDWLYRLVMQEVLQHGSMGQIRFAPRVQTSDGLRTFLRIEFSVEDGPVRYDGPPTSPPTTEELMKMNNAIMKNEGECL